MQRLPKLAVGSAEWRFPLAEQVAARLAAALVRGDWEQQRRSFGELLRDDPALALWAICRLQRFSPAPIDSVEQLADLFSRHALRLLQWTEEESAAAASRIAADAASPGAKQWSERSEIGIAAASRALALAEAAGASRAIAGAAELLGLLGAASDWLAACRCRETSESGETSEHGCLPPWLRDGLAAMARNPSDNSAAAFAAAAVAQVRAEFNERPPAPGGGEPARPERRLHSDSGHPAAWSGHLPQLVRKLARLEELEAHFAETLEREKIESLYQFAYGASHEINNPLANISSRAQLLLRDETDHRRREMLASINAQAFRGHEMILNVMHFARPPQPVRRQTDLAALADRVVAELAHDARQQGTQLVRKSGGPLSAQVDPDHIAVALRAMCVNALESLGMGGRVEVDVRRSADVENGGWWAELAVRDTGPGIPDEVRRHVFDPFYSGREAGRGLGFGLSKCWRIVTMHGGRIDVDGDCGGALFTMRLPLEPPAAPDQKAAG